MNVIFQENNWGLFVRFTAVKSALSRAFRTVDPCPSVIVSPCTRLVNLFLFSSRSWNVMLLTPDVVFVSASNLSHHAPGGSAQGMGIGR